MDSTAIDGSTQDVLCGSLLRFIDQGQVAPLRQALSSYNHRCRNLLNGLKISLYLAKKSGAPTGGPWGEIDATYAAVEQFFERISVIYRTMPLTPVRGRLGALVHERVEDWRRMFREKGASFDTLAPATEEPGRFDPAYLGAAIEAFAGWRAAAMPKGGRVCFSWETTCDEFVVRWSEEGSSDAWNDALAAPESSSPLTAAAGSLSVPLLARVVTEHGGRLDWTRGPQVEAVLRWPLSGPDAIVGRGGEGFAGETQ